MKKIFFITALLITVAYCEANAQCIQAIAQTDLDIANVRASVLSGGDMWRDFSAPNIGYEVPMGTGKNSIFAGGLWIGGMDAGGQIKTACMTYRQTGIDFWNGPLDANGNVSSATCATYDKIWKLNKTDIQDFITTGSTTNQDIISYPGNRPGSNAPLAPYVDYNGDGVYNYADGDYPYFNFGTGVPSCCETLHGDQCLWWVINDVGNAHSETQSILPIGIEVQCQAYAFDTAHSLTSTTTFYQYTIINKSTYACLNTYFGQWVDPDLGNPTDNYVGCDVIKGVGYCYNGDGNDEGASGYGIAPPAIGFDFLRGPLADENDGVDNNRNGIIDEPNEEIIMSNFMTYVNDTFSPTGTPDGFTDYYNYLRSVWRDGQPLTYGGTGHFSSNPPCYFMFPDTTDSYFPGITNKWTEITSANAPGDRRFVMSAGPFTMQPGEVNCITVAVVWARDINGNNISNKSLMLTTDSLIQIEFDNCFSNFTTGITKSTLQNAVDVYPNPFSDKTIIRFSNSKGEEVYFKLYDINGKLVKEISGIKTNTLELKNDNLTPGIYFLSLNAKSSKAISCKIVIP